MTGTEINGSVTHMYRGSHRKPVSNLTLFLLSEVYYISFKNKYLTFGVQDGEKKDPVRKKDVKFHLEFRLCKRQHKERKSADVLYSATVLTLQTQHTDTLVPPLLTTTSIRSQIKASCRSSTSASLENIPVSGEISPLKSPPWLSYSMHGQSESFFIQLFCIWGSKSLYADDKQKNTQKNWELDIRREVSLKLWDITLDEHSG